MTRSVIPITVPDLSGFARALRRSLAEHLAEHAALPTHQALLNHIARAVGHRNLQALHAQAPRPCAPAVHRQPRCRRSARPPPRPSARSTRSAA